MKLKIRTIDFRLEIYVEIGHRTYKNEFRIGLKLVTCVLIEISSNLCTKISKCNLPTTTSTMAEWTKLLRIKPINTCK